MTRIKRSDGKPVKERQVARKLSDGDDETAQLQEVDPRDLDLEVRALRSLHKPKKHRALYRHQTPRKFGRAR